MRANRRYHHTTGRYRHLPTGCRTQRDFLGTLACALPILFGFVLPALVVVHDAVRHIAAGLAPEFWDAAVHSLIMSAAAACLAVAFAVRLGYARRQTRSKLIHTRHPGDQLRSSWRGACHRLPHPARQARQWRGRGDALAVQHTHGASVGHPLLPSCLPTPSAFLPRRSVQLRRP